MGRCCVRFRRIEQVPLDVVAALLRRVTANAYVEHYEANIRSVSVKASAEAKAKPATKKATTTKASNASKASKSGKTGTKPAQGKPSKGNRP
jgi:parvulin-like peptidyl-prolyl isomerase